MSIVFIMPFCRHSLYYRQYYSYRDNHSIFQMISIILHNLRLSVHSYRVDLDPSFRNQVWSHLSCAMNYQGYVYLQSTHGLGDLLIPSQIHFLDKSEWKLNVHLVDYSNFLPGLHLLRSVRICNMTFRIAPILNHTLKWKDTKNAIISKHVSLYIPNPLNKLIYKYIISSTM